MGLRWMMLAILISCLSSLQPDDKAENPADLAAIDEAERNMGDFKLKR